MVVVLILGKTFYCSAIACLLPALIKSSFLPSFSGFNFKTPSE